ncbi:unnamed protein product [Nesidiocoris tenuis]|uniref:Uncharacterized protein n=1 Tax=Nesidiocoris tenuis TaxID=355587 RepID=A0A6H5GH98_9HEMI|nr:unnamed protein product [Nesidiocoris tenuis]
MKGKERGTSLAPTRKWNTVTTVRDGLMHLAKSYASPYLALICHRPQLSSDQQGFIPSRLRRESAIKPILFTLTSTVSVRETKRRHQLQVFLMATISLRQYKNLRPAECLLLLTFMGMNMNLSR